MTLPNEPISPRRGGLNRRRSPPTIKPAALRSSTRSAHPSEDPHVPSPPTSAREYSLRLGHCEQAQRTAGGLKGALYPRMKPCDTCACIFETNDQGTDGIADIVDDLCKDCRKVTRLNELHQILNHRPLGRCLDPEQEQPSALRNQDKSESREKNINEFCPGHEDIHPEGRRRGVENVMGEARL